jgi:hypothetical protein
VRALGHYSPYGSYWAALSMITDGADPATVEKYVEHVAMWSKEHTLLRPRILHLRAELTCKVNVIEVLADPL